jgi:hypothetical protein
VLGTAAPTSRLDRVARVPLADLVVDAREVGGTWQFLTVKSGVSFFSFAELPGVNITSKPTPEPVATIAGAYSGAQIFGDRVYAAGSQIALIDASVWDAPVLVAESEPFEEWIIHRSLHPSADDSDAVVSLRDRSTDPETYVTVRYVRSGGAFVRDAELLASEDYHWIVYRRNELALLSYLDRMLWIDAADGTPASDEIGSERVLEVSEDGGLVYVLQDGDVQPSVRIFSIDGAKVELVAEREVFLGQRLAARDGALFILSSLYSNPILVTAELDASNISSGPTYHISTGDPANVLLRAGERHLFVASTSTGGGAVQADIEWVPRP